MCCKCEYIFCWNNFTSPVCWLTICVIIADVWIHWLVIGGARSEWQFQVWYDIPNSGEATQFSQCVTECWRHWGDLALNFNPLAPQVSCSQCTVWCQENRMSRKVSAKNMCCNERPFKCQVLSRVHWALNSGPKG